MNETELHNRIDKLMNAAIKEGWTQEELTAVGIGVMLQGLANMTASGKFKTKENMKRLALRFIETEEMFSVMPGCVLLQ
jgi:hypothetical protein